MSVVGFKAAAVGSKREQRRAERRALIKQAAEAVFAERGYVRSTTQEIAARAGVAVGTLFLYAPEKRDLLFLIVNDDLDVLTSSTFATMPDVPLLEQLMHIYGPRYRFYGARPDLSRHILHEMMFARAAGDRHVEVARAELRRNTIVNAIASVIIRPQQDRGLLKPGDAESIGWLFHALYLAEIRAWLTTPNPDVSKGLARLEDMLSWPIVGVGA